MEQYILKSAVVAEIKRRIAFFSDINNKQVIDSNLDCAIAFAGLRDFLDTLEVKEVQEEPVSENLEEVANKYGKDTFVNECMENGVCDNYDLADAFKAGANWQKEQDQETIELAEDHAMLAGMEKMKEQMIKNLWKPADGDDLPEIDREVIALTQPYPNDEHLKVVFAHRPNKYAKVWNSDLGEEQVVEIEGYDKGGWNIPDVKWWLDCLLPKEIEL